MDAVHRVAEFTWSFPEPGDSAFVLRSAGAPVGRLQFEENPSAPSIAEFQGRRWVFEHKSAADPTVTIRSQDSTVAAVFTPSLTGGGTATLSSGRHYHWTRKHIGSPAWCFRNDEDRCGVCVSQQTGPLTAGGKVTLCAKAAECPDTVVLVLLAWYLRILEFEKLSESIFVCG